MRDQNHGLFRREVYESKARKLEGDVSLAIPMSWQMIGYLLLSVLLIAAAFLFTASFPRVENATGAIALDTGTAQILPSRSGVVAELNVKEGSQVNPGDVLASIRSEEDLAEGATSSQRMLSAITQQDARLASQGDALRDASTAERATLSSRLSGLADELVSVDAQIATQRQLVAVAEQDFSAIQGAANQGFVSRRDRNERESILLSRRQQLAQLEQARAAKRSQVAEARRTMTQLTASAEAQASGLQSTRAELLRQQTQIETSRGYALTAPIRGTVTALTARLGHPALQSQPLMTIMPADASMVAELQVGTQAAGFLAPGQTVRLAVDAFPYQRFGTVEARIRNISAVAVAQPGPNGTTVAVYLVTAEIPDPSVEAFGRRQPLLPGMTLTARIETARQSLFEWLFEPLFAIARR